MKRIRLVFTLLLLCLALPLSAEVINLNREEARQVLSANNPALIVLDVRTPEEFASGHLPGAININFMAPGFAEKVAALDQSKEIFVYCRSGNRSSQALQAMKGLGFKKTYHLFQGVKGGFPLPPE